ncbi:hypothetical protein FGB62_157g14 [Gracilaria domingensis]|nr:hypothetical protein FGB62_157g14 [Gracilaria domingensis]
MDAELDSELELRDNVEGFGEREEGSVREGVGCCVTSLQSGVRRDLLVGRGFSCLDWAGGRLWMRRGGVILGKDVVVNFPKVIQITLEELGICYADVFDEIGVGCCGAVMFVSSEDGEQARKGMTGMDCVLE